MKIRSCSLTRTVLRKNGEITLRRSIKMLNRSALPKKGELEEISKDGVCKAWKTMELPQKDTGAGELETKHMIVHIDLIYNRIEIKKSRNMTKKSRRPGGMAARFFRHISISFHFYCIL
jgi:hypothetical protein